MDELKHYGTKGQKWGIRKYQNPDGSYTELGKERRRVGHDDASEQTPKVEIGKKKTGFFARLKQKREAKKAEERKRNHARAIREGDIAYASENINEFSADEIEKLVNRRWDMEKVYRFQREDEQRARSALDAASQKFATKLKTMADVTKSMATIKKNLDILSGKKVPDKEKEKKKGDKFEKAKFSKKPKDEDENERDDKPRFVKKKNDSQKDQNKFKERNEKPKYTNKKARHIKHETSDDDDDDVKVSSYKKSWFDSSDDDLDYKFDLKDSDFGIRVSDLKKNRANSLWNKYVTESDKDWNNVTVKTSKSDSYDDNFLNYKFDNDYKPYKAPQWNGEYEATFEGKRKKKRK